MIKGEYQMVATCDICGQGQQFIDEGRVSCKRLREKAGWRRVAGDDICPKCVAEIRERQFGDPMMIQHKETDDNG